MEEPIDIIPYDADALREKEYPMLQDETYLDHTGTTLYAQSALTCFMDEMSSNLFGNPHSDSRSSRLSTERVDEIRRQTLEFFHADPEHFDLVFVMNATAAIKLVLEGLTHLPVSDGPEKTLKGPGLWVGYHVESHTSVVGLRELADAGQHCFMSDSEVEAWIRPSPVRDKTDRCPGQTSKTFQVGILAYPGQSNMTGRRLPLHWPGRLRQSEYASHQRVFTLLDAAALAPTASLDCFRDPDGAPDFTAVSFYKIFGFPDLGGLIVRKGSAQALVQRPYFGGGTVEMVTCSDHPWHSRNPSYIHEILEDGTVPFHSILALGCALTTHKQLYTSQEHVSHHTTRLTAHLYQLLSSLRHPNGVKVCEIYRDPAAEYGNSTTQGSIVAFNICSDEGRWLRLSHIEEAANKHRIHLRTGSVCNPGGLAKLLQLDEWELFQNYTAGVRCGCRSVLVGHKPSGIIRVSLGAMSTLNDVEHFVGFVHHLFGAGAFPLLVPTSPSNPPTSQHLHVHTLMIYPIHGAAAYTIPAHQSWHLTSTGLQWDRQWCLVNLQTGSALDQRHAPRLLLLQPMIDAVHGILRITVHHSLRRRNPKLRQSMTVPLHDPGRDVQVPKGNLYQCQATSLGKLHGPEDGTGLLRLFHSPDLVAFFTAALGVPCTMARFLDPADCISPAWRTLPEQQPMAEVHVSPSDQPLLSLPPEQTQTIPHEESQDGQPSRRSLPVALTETLRANALLASDTATAAIPDNRQWCLLQFGPREQQAQASIVQYGRMKAVAITAERQSPEIFERTSPVVKIVWREGNEGTLSVRAGQPLVLRE